MERIAQEDANGCGIACLAMVTSRAYRDVRGEVDSELYRRQMVRYDPSRDGFEVHVLDHYLLNAGFAIQRQYRIHFEPKTDPHEWGNTENWPCQPWAPIHIASVVQPSGNAHFVVVSKDGIVLDPLGHHDDLRAWEQVSNITGLFRVDRDCRPA